MEHGYDVIVIGSGLAGTAAAIEAARAGSRVAILSAGPLFSGSSFFPGTWGLGLIGPRSESDADDLIATICEVGGGVADPELVGSFVRGIPEAISWLEHDLDVRLKRPANEQSAQETAFIPCFDRTPRLWRGITREAYLEAARRELDALGVDVLERCDVLDLLEERGASRPTTNGENGRFGQNGHAICGVEYFDLRNQELQRLPAKSVVLATGGTGGLFDRSLTARDVESSAQGIALAHGARLVNIEFMQMMPGLVAPKRNLVFNEKTFRYIDWIDPAARELLPSGSELRDLLELRSSHGPFTSRVGDHAVDLAIEAAGAEGLGIRYRFPTRNVPEFVQTFSHWLEHEHGITPDSELRIAMYAHAANGGIQIDQNGWTGVDGLFACGEVTGGMHGADRIGGLASANALIFGRRAGKAASAWAAGRQGAPSPVDGTLPARSEATPLLDIQTAKELTARMRDIMGASCMVRRDATGLERAESELRALRNSILDAPRTATESHDEAAARARTLKLRAQLSLALSMAHAMYERKQSLGSHYRTDDANAGHDLDAERNLN